MNIAESLYNFTESKYFESFKDKVKFGTTSSETSLEIYNTVKKFRPSLRFYTDGSIGYCDCNSEEKDLLEQVYKEWLNYKKLLRTKILNILAII